MSLRSYIQGTCAKCGKELKKVLPRGHEAPKRFLKREGYDGVEWVEFYINVEGFNFPYLPESYEGYKKALFVKFCLCLKCTPKDFKFTGEKEITEVA